MIKSIDNVKQNNNSQILINHNKKQQPIFKGGAGIKFLDSFVKSQENLSVTRFVQDTTTNWFPKAALSRSKADFWEFSFLEFLESGLFYFAAPLLGEHLYRNKLFKKIQPKNLKQDISNFLPKSLEEIKKSNLDKNLKKQLISTKGGIVLACLAVPTLEYALSFAKNLFTLKVFKISDFNNVANLSKDQKEDSKQQQKVEKHAKKEIIKAGVLSVAGVGAGLALAAKGHNSNSALKFSEILLEPGVHISKLLHKAGIKSPKTDKFLADYLKLDFVNNNGKLALSKGQLAVTCITGLFGYSDAAKDRGKLDFYEVWTRVPLVVLYTIFGSSFLDGGFKKLLLKHGKCKDLLNKDKNGIINVPTRNELPKIAEELATQNNTTKNVELTKLIKQKALITGVPYLFSLVAMGFTLTAVTRIWTQFRYNHLQKSAKNNNPQPQQTFGKISPAFSGFKTVAH